MCATGVAVAYTSNGGPADAAKDQFGVLVSHLSENAYSTTVKPIKLSDVAWIRGVSDDDLLDVTTTYWDDTNVMMYWQGDPPKNRKVRRLYNLLLVCLMTAVRCRTQGSTLDMIMKKCITNRSASRAEDLSADYERYVAFLCAQRKIFAAADWDNEEHKALLNLLKLVGTALAVDFTTNDGSQAVQYEDILRQLTTIDNEAGQALIVMNDCTPEDGYRSLYETVELFCPITLLGAMPIVTKGACGSQFDVAVTCAHWLVCLCCRVGSTERQQASIDTRVSQRKRRCSAASTSRR